MTKPELYRDEKVKAIAATLPTEPATPPPNMAEFL